jgi:hypothetical protein
VDWSVSAMLIPSAYFGGQTSLANLMARSGAHKRGSVL